MILKYKPRNPNIIEVVQYNTDNYFEVIQFILPDVFTLQAKEGNIILGLKYENGWSKIKHNSFLMRSLNGELINYDYDIFMSFYESVPIEQY